MNNDKPTLRLVTNPDAGSEIAVYADLNWPEALSRFVQIVDRIIAHFDDEGDDYIFSIIANPHLTKNKITKKFDDFHSITRSARDRIRDEKFLLFKAFENQLGNSPFRRIENTMEAKDFRKLEVTLDDKVGIKSSVMYYVALKLLHKRNHIIDISDVPQRLNLLESYAKRTAGEGVAEYAKLLFPELSTSESIQSTQASQSPLPSVAPETYAGLRGPETPPQFIARVYGEWFGRGLNVGYLRRVDPSLVRSLAYYRQSGGEFPENFNLPAGKPGKTPFAASDDADRNEIEKSAVRRYLREKQAKTRSSRNER